jgi:hypothetical protein
MLPRFLLVRTSLLALSAASLFAADVIDASLLLRYNFDAAPVGNLIVDSSPSAAHPGTNQNAVWTSNDAGRSGVMNFIAPIPDRMVVPAIPALNASVGTISFWIKTSMTLNPDDYVMIMDRRLQRGDVITLNDAGTLFVQAREGNQNKNAFAGTAVLNDGQWHHVAYVYDQSEGGSTSLYVDGVLDATQANSGAWGWPATQQLEFGSSHDPFWKPLDGFLDDVMIHNRQLTEAEITATAGGAPVTDSSLVLRLNFAAAPVGDVIVDSSASNNSGTNSGADWVAADGTHNGVMRFLPPLTTQISVASAPDLDAGTGTIAFWMKSSGNTGPGDFASILFDRRTGGLGDVIAMQDDGALFVQAQGFGTGVNSFSTQGKVSDDVWHHVAYVYDQSAAGYIKIYIDGALSGSNSNTGEWAWPVDQPLEFGLSHDNYWFAFNGEMDDIRVYNRALTDAEITQVGVTPRLRFDVQPMSQTVFVGDEVTLRAAANVEATYQWKLNNVNISGATSNVLYIASVKESDAGSYTVSANSALGPGTSEAAVLTVLPRPSLEASLVARYPFDAPPVNDVIVDAAPGGEHPGTNNLATWTAEAGGRNGVMLFSSVDPGSQITVAPHAEFDASRGTIAFWMKSPGAQAPGEWGAILFDRRSDRGDVIVMRDETADVPGALFVQTYAPSRVNSFETPTFWS